MKQLLKFKYILLLLVITFVGVVPLLHPGFPPTHDGENHVIRFYVFDKALREGDLYPRWASELNMGYGIPLFNYVYPLPNYFGSLFHFLGLSFIDLFKISLLVATFIGVIFLYLWMRLFTAELAAFTAAVFYAFAPYRFVDIYVRGSVGEVWALAWFPGFLWAITLLLQKHKIRYVLLAAVFLAATIFSHNILALMFTIFGVAYASFLVLQAKKKRLFIAYCSLLIALGLGLSAIFWLPALLETKYVQGLQIYDLDPNFPELYQLLIPSWGTGFSAGKLDNQMSFQIGVANLVAVFLGFVLLLRRHQVLDSVARRSNSKKLLFFFLGWFVLTTFLMLGFSKPIWHTIPLLEYFQFPWRLLSLVIIICSAIAGISIEMISGRKKRFIVATFFVSMAVLLTVAYTKPAYYHNRTDAHYLTRSNFIHGTNSPGDVFNTIWMNKDLPLKKDNVEVIRGEVKLTVQDSKTSRLRFTIDGKRESQLIANIAYFPGWTLLIDGKQHALERTKDGIIAFSVPKGKHTVELVFNDTMVRKVAAGISVAALLVCVGMVGFRRKGIVDRG